MNLEEEYRLSEFQDLGALNTREKIRLKRHKIYGTICVEKRVSPDLKHIYDFLKNNPTSYIPEIYECILDNNVLIIVEEYVTGRNLDDIVREKKLSEADAVKIALELCKVLKILHNANPPVICRDIKAENVMVDNNHCIKIVDFDISRTYQKGKKRDTVLLGTVEYAAPEQFGYFQTDNRTDIYALGILINYMVTGKFPVEQMVEGRLYGIVHKSTYIDPKERYQTVEEMEVAIKKAYPECEKKPGKSVDDKKKEMCDYGYALPGFRSGVMWKKIVATFGYLFLTYLCLSLELKRNGVELTAKVQRIEQAAIWLSQMVFIGIVYNYRGWRDGIPILKIRNRIVRIAGYVAVDVFLIFIVSLLCGIFELILL